jgi:hypothetical protein
VGPFEIVLSFSSISLPSPPGFPKWSFPSRFLKQHFFVCKKEVIKADTGNV